MKQRLLVSFLALGTLVALNGLPAFGMVTGELKVSVPFEFRVGNTTMPAGRYLIISTDDNEPNLLEIRNESGSPTILVMTEPVTSPHTVTGRSEMDGVHFAANQARPMCGILFEVPQFLVQTSPVAFV